MSRLAFSPLDREMFSLAVPALGALIAEPLYVLADTAVIGHIGTLELGGLGLASQIISTVVAVSLFLAYGTTSAVSRLLGAGRDRDAAHQAVQGLWIALVAGLMFSVLCFVLAPTLLNALQAEPEVARHGQRYLRVSVFGFPAMLLMLAGVGYLRGMKDTRRPLYIALATALGNLVLELILVFGLGFGVGASALSTVIFQWCGAGLYVWWIATGVRVHSISWAPDFSTLRQLGRDGFALFVRTSSLRGTFLAAAAFAAALGSVPLAAHEIAMAVFFFVALSLDAVAIAAQAMVGTLLGAGDVEQARRVGQRLTGWGACLGVVAGIALLLASPWLGGIFTDDNAVATASVGVLVVLGLAQPIAGAAFALDGILIGAGDLRYLAKAMVISAIAFATLLAIVWKLDGGINALWWALFAFLAVRLTTLLWRLRTDKWLHVGPLAG